MTHNPFITNTPFYINTKEGKYLVIKAIKVCDIRTVDCEGTKASCVLKVEKPTSPCERTMSPCERAARSSSPTRNPNTVPFIRTNLLEDMQANNRSVVSRILGN
ncbi:DNA-binding virion core protein [Swinepox virus]|uniref:DNA-binding virion core protein n=1 Tax=Swinepox virus TaxID=10276 RepID=A0A881SY09_SWPV|nr:DNA-binding virion core protein [Swinepox virus]